MSIIVQLGEARSFLKERKVFLYLYYLSIAAVLIGFLYSRALLSIGQISIAAVWLLEGDLREKLRRLKEDKLGVFLAGLYLIHVIWLLNTSNFIYAGEDLRIKLPLLLFPIVFSSTDILDKKSFKYLLYLFVSVILSSTIVISVNYLFHGKEMKDIREASFLISHIRLALMICLSIAVLIYYASKENTLFRIVAVAIVFWFALYMFMFVYLTGIILLSILLLCMLFWFMRKRSINQKIQRGILLVLILSFGFMAVYMLFVTMDYYQANKEKNVADLEWTANGNPYKQFYKGEGFTIRENGYLVYQNVHFEEVQAAWNNRSTNKVTYFDDDYAEIEDVIIRFIASKGLPKDSFTISQLTEKEIQAIESGITNVHYMDKSNSYKRLYNMLWQYDVYISGGNFNGHSLGIRMEFWKTGWHVFKRHLLFGTGTGDIEDAFQEQYDLDQSKLTKQWRFRSHNQIISMAATFGIFGLVYFLLLLFLPAWLNRDKFLYLCFALIFFVSVLTEDTLETQIGVTFYAFFSSLLLFQGRRLTDAKKD